MKTAPTPATALQRLALKWQVLGMMLVALAREISLAHKMHAEAGVRKAELLEAALYAGLVQLSGDIAAQTSGKARSREDETTIAYLSTVHKLLGALALLIRQLKADLEAASAIRPRWQASWQPFLKR